MKNVVPNGLYAVYDLGTYSIKVALIERNSGKNRVIGIDSEPLKPHSDFPGDAEFRDHQAQVLKTLADRLPLKNISAHISLFNCREMQVKIVDFPREIPENQIESVLRWEAQKILLPTLKNDPNKLKDEPFIFSYRNVFGSLKSYVLAVIPLIRLQRHIDLFSLVGIQLNAAFPEVFMAMALKESLAVFTSQAVSIVNIGFANTHIQIFSRGELRFYRHIPSGLKEVYSSAGQENFEGFSQKIRFSFDYFRAVTKLPHIDEIILLGGGAANKDFMTFAKDYFAPGKVQCLDISSLMDISTIVGSYSHNEALLYSCYPAIACFQARVLPEFATTDLLGQWYKQLEQERIKRLTMSVPALLAGIGLIFVISLLLFMRASMLGQLEQINEKGRIHQIEIDALKLKIAKTQAQFVETNILPQEKRILGRLLNERLSGGEILSQVALKKPQGMVLENVKIVSVMSSEEREEDDIFVGESNVFENIEAVSTKSSLAVESSDDPFEIFSTASESLSVTSSATQLKPSVSGKPPIPVKFTKKIILDIPASESVDELCEKFLQISGSCSSWTSLLEYLKSLQEIGIITRLHLFKSEIKNNRLQFSFAGELP